MFSPCTSLIQVSSAYNTAFFNLMSVSFIERASFIILPDAFTHVVVFVVVVVVVV